MEIFFVYGIGKKNRVEYTYKGTSLEDAMQVMSACESQKKRFRTVILTKLTTSIDFIHGTSMTVSPNVVLVEYREIG